MFYPETAPSAQIWQGKQLALRSARNFRCCLDRQEFVFNTDRSVLRRLCVTTMTEPNSTTRNKRCLIIRMNIVVPSVRLS